MYALYMHLCYKVEQMALQFWLYRMRGVSGLWQSSEGRN